MRGKHEPRGEFVDTLEREIVRKARRREERATGVRPWWPEWSPRTVAAALALVVVSMGIGGGVVVAAYQVQSAAQRDLLLSTFEQRTQLASDRLALAQQQMKDAELRVSIGTAGQESLLDARLKLTRAQADLQSIRLQVEEVRSTGEEPRDQISAPLVSGRDFVSERLKVELTVPQAALQAEAAQLKAVERRVAVGLAEAADLDAARARVAEIQAAIEGFQRKIAIRQQFLAGQTDATTADLQELLSEAEQGRKALLPKVEVARQDVARARSRFERGLVPQVEVKQAELRLMELQLELTRREVDLANLQKRLKGK